VSSRVRGDSGFRCASSPQHPSPSRSRSRLVSRRAATYVDGELRGVLRRVELSGSLRPRNKRLLDGRSAERFAVVDYLASIGVDVSRVRAVHFHGGRGRVSVVGGELLRKYRDTLLLGFTQGTRGKPALELPDDDGFRINTSIDIAQAVAVYVDRTPPVFDRALRGLVLDGARVDGPAYVPVEELRGTRVYLDGRLVGALKRKTLPDALLADGSDGATPRFSLERWLASLGVTVGSVRVAEFVSGDDVVARADASRWPSAHGRLEFTIPRRSQGRLLLDFPAGTAELADAHEGSGRVSAILLHTRAPARRSIEPFPEEPAASENRPAVASAGLVDDD
jgi:hypothetical protein